ncbi:MAG TPA: hypothetical protein VK512_17940 [Xanthobacteraceae bacterium]|nr:hypothetical protein [Xanthobacteraceae bacterium]
MDSSSGSLGRSIMARSAYLRLSALLGIIACLWLAILWAVSLP